MHKSRRQRRPTNIPILYRQETTKENPKLRPEEPINTPTEDIGNHTHQPNMEEKPPTKHTVLTGTKKGSRHNYETNTLKTKTT